MRRVTVRVPEGQSAEVVRLALAAGAGPVFVHPVQAHRASGDPARHEVVEFDGPTPTARRFVEELMAASFFDPATHSLCVVHPRAVAGHEPPAVETRPVWMPAVDVYEDLWQFSHVTVSLVGRVFLAALLLAYGMVEMNLPLMIAGLLFLPYHHHLLSIALGLRTREWRLAGQGALALLVSTALIIAAGAAVALFTEPPLRFQQFGTPMTGLLIALLIGVCAALAAADDAGRRELIGLAATAHITVLPAWLGIELVLGLPEAKTVAERLFSFGLSVGALIAAAAITFAGIRLGGEGVRRFAQGASSSR